MLYRAAFFGALSEGINHDFFILHIPWIDTFHWCNNLTIHMLLSVIPIDEIAIGFIHSLRGFSQDSHSPMFVTPFSWQSFFHSVGFHVGVCLLFIMLITMRNAFCYCGPFQETQERVKQCSNEPVLAGQHWRNNWFIELVDIHWLIDWLSLSVVCYQSFHAADRACEGNCAIMGVCVVVQWTGRKD